jgi:hypothetical protein
MFSRGHHTAIFIISKSMLIFLEDLLAKFIVTYTLKNKQTMWLCIIKGYLSSLRDLVSSRLSTQNALE